MTPAELRQYLTAHDAELQAVRARDPRPSPAFEAERRRQLRELRRRMGQS